MEKSPEYVAGYARLLARGRCFVPLAARCCAQLADFSKIVGRMPAIKHFKSRQRTWIFSGTGKTEQTNPPPASTAVPRLPENAGLRHLYPGLHRAAAEGVMVEHSRAIRQFHRMRRFEAFRNHARKSLPLFYLPLHSILISTRR